MLERSSPGRRAQAKGRDADRFRRRAKPQTVSGLRRTLSAGIRVTGAWLDNLARYLAADGHAQFMVTDLQPSVAGYRGMLEFGTPPGGQIAVLGIQASASGAITSVPALAK